MSQTNRVGKRSDVKYRCSVVSSTLCRLQNRVGRKVSVYKMFRPSDSPDTINVSFPVLSPEYREYTQTYTQYLPIGLKDISSCTLYHATSDHHGIRGRLCQNCPHCYNQHILWSCGIRQHCGDSRQEIIKVCGRNHRPLSSILPQSSKHDETFGCSWISVRITW